MQFWIIQGLNSLSLGGLLFLLSSGFSLIFGLMRLANLTHGAFFMLGTYLAATALRSFDGLNIWTTAIGAGFVVAALGGLFERLVLTRLKANPLGQALVTLGMSFIISDACLIIWGGDSIPVPTPQNLQAPTRLFGFVFPTYRLVLVGVAVLVAVALYLLIERTRLGAMIRAGVDDRAKSQACAGGRRYRGHPQYRALRFCGPSQRASRGRSPDRAKSRRLSCSLNGKSTC
jgi:branched-chain amino acid transport system permease protein